MRKKGLKNWINEHTCISAAQHTQHTYHNTTQHKRVNKEGREIGDKREGRTRLESAWLCSLLKHQQERWTYSFYTVRTSPPLHPIWFDPAIPFSTLSCLSCRTLDSTSTSSRTSAQTIHTHDYLHRRIPLSILDCKVLFAVNDHTIYIYV